MQLHHDGNVCETSCCQVAAVIKAQVAKSSGSSRIVLLHCQDVNDLISDALHAPKRERLSVRQVCISVAIVSFTG